MKFSILSYPINLIHINVKQLILSHIIDPVNPKSQINNLLRRNGGVGGTGRENRGETSLLEFLPLQHIKSFFFLKVPPPPHKQKGAFWPIWPSKL